MKKSYLLTLALAAVMAVGGLAGCSKSDDEEQAEFSFSVDIEGDYSDLEIRSEPYKLVVYDNGVDNADRKYTYSSSAPAVAEILSNTGAITAKSVGSVTFTCTEQNSGLKAYKTVSVVEAAPKAQGGYNFAAAGTAEERQARTEILGKLEKYAMDTHLTGISLFENGGYMLFSQRAKDLLPTNEYITGYGFGLLSDADHGFTTNLPGDNPDADYPKHYHTVSSSDPQSINALNAAGSQISDLSSYITSSYFSQRMNGNKNGAYWYPVLASDVHNAETAEGLPKMFHTGDDNPTNMYTGWKIYVKTDENTGGNLKYHHYINKDTTGSYDNRGVKLEDYEFIIRFLLTGSHNLRRGNEMAADTSYGIKGAQSYNLQTASTDDDTSKQIWKTMQDSGKLGFRTGHDDKGDYLEFELMNPVDSFTAMYTLSSSLYSPIPEEFMLWVGENKDNSDKEHRLDRAAKRYGAFNNNNDFKDTDIRHNNIMASTICLGPYFLQQWDKTVKTVFTRNDNWFECGTRYQIKGVRIRINDAIDTNLDAYYDEFKAGNLDACSLPQKHMNEKGSALKARGDSVFKLNVNSCTQEQWDYNFKGDSGKIAKNRHWDVKPWMSNDNFLNGLFWSIDRKTFAEARGVNPSINYFSDAYMSDPTNNVSYNSTDEHIEAVKSYHNVRKDGEGNITSDDYGYNKGTAINYFKTAVAQLVKRGALKYGTVDNPEVIKIEIWWMNQSDISEYGNDIKNYFESAFNDPQVSGKRIKLNVVNNAVTVWEYVYDQHLMVGEFDLGFGAISGNTYNPLNFMEVLKSDNSSSFTLNWGADTSIVDPRHALVYQGQKYSYDALWEVADHGGIVNEGRKVAAIEDLYLETFSTLKGRNSLKLFPKFVNVGSTAVLKVTDARIYVIGGKMFGSDEGVWYDPDTKTLSFHNYMEGDEEKNPLEEIEKSIQHANKWDLPEYPGDEDTKDHLTRDGNYGVYWYVDVTYTISINGGQPTINYAVANATSGHWN